MNEIVRSNGQPLDVGGNDRQTELAWAAGFFDGEGHIAIHRTRDTSSFSLNLSMAQVDPSPILDFQEILGIGTIGPHRTKQPNHKDAVVWQSWGAKAGEVLVLLRPYLRHKATQADVAIAFQKNKVRHRGVVATPEEYALGEWSAKELRRIRTEFGTNN
jgi:hypothetical protein